MVIVGWMSGAAGSVIIPAYLVGKQSRRPIFFHAHYKKDCA